MKPHTPKQALTALIALAALITAALTLTACGALDGGGESGYGSSGSWAAPAEGSSDASASNQQGAPRLTGGIWDDNADPEHYARYAEEWAAPELSDLPTRRQLIRVVDAAGAPVRGAKVEVTAGERQVTLRTVDHGYALYAPALDGVSQRYAVNVKLGSQRAAGEFERVDGEEAPWVLTLPEAVAAPARALDLALVVDATGSMGDELSFLKRELSSILAQLQARYPEVDIRVSLTHYRDEGDQYVTRGVPFTGSLERLQRELSAVEADGGGDTPEAMAEALEETLALGWRDGADVARVAFLVADAPPQRFRQARADSAARRARELGVRFFPIASSGVDGEAEWVMRQLAAFSLGQYIFLTDDSGLGGAHAEPNIPCYEVRLLQTLMLRVVESAVVGAWPESSPGEVIRSVGVEEGACEGHRPLD